MKLHLPLALLAAVVCVSTPVAHANYHSNVEDYLRTETNQTGIFEHSYNKETGAVTITLHEGDFSMFDMYRHVIGVTSADEGIVMGASALPDRASARYASSTWSENEDIVNSVSITIDGAYKTEGKYEGTDNDYRLEVCGIGLPSLWVRDVPGYDEDNARINITMLDGIVSKIVGGFNCINKSNDIASGDAFGLGVSPYILGAKYSGSINISIQGGTVDSVVGGHTGKDDRIKDHYTRETLKYLDKDGNVVSETNTMAHKDENGKIIIDDQEKYANFTLNKYWAVGGDVNIEITDGEIGKVLGAGGNCHSVDGDVTISMSGGKVTGNVVVGPSDNFAEVGGSATMKVTGNACIEGNIYGTNLHTKDTDVIGSKSIEPTPVIKGNSTIILAGKANVGGDVYAAGDGGRVEGNTEVYLQDNAVVKGLVSGIGINGAALAKDSTATLYVGTESKAYTGSVGAIEGFTKLIVTKGSSLQMSAGNVFAANKQIITLSAANLQNAALIGTSAIVGNEGLELTLLADEPLSSGKYKIAELSSGKMRAATNNPDGWSEENVTVNGIAGINDTAWEGTTLYLTWKEQNVDAAIVSNWGAFKSSQAFTGTLWGNRSNAVVLDDKTAAPATVPNDGKAPVAAAEQPTPAAHATTLAWASAYGQSGRISNAGADYSLYGAAMGIERQFGATGSSIGVAFGYDWGKVSPFTTTSADQETWHAALYGRVGTWKAGKGIVSVDWSAAYGDTTTEHNDFASDWSQDSWQLDLRATYAQAISERATASVFAGVQYYTHDDATVDNMHISSLQNLRLTAGAGLSYAATARTNVYGQASVYFDAMRHNPHVDANGACFKGTNPGRIGGILSVGADYSITDRWTLRGAYSFDVAKNSNEHNVNAGVQYSF